MKKSVLTLYLALSISAAFLMSDASAANGDNPKVFTDKAAELTVGKTDKTDKLLCLHEFVRDKVRQIPTVYG